MTFGRNYKEIALLKKKMEKLKGVPLNELPAEGWLKHIRTSLGIKLRQVAKKLNLSCASVQRLEKREQQGSITLNSLEAAARALDMDLVYFLIPKDKSIDKLIERKAESLVLNENKNKNEHSISVFDKRERLNALRVRRDSFVFEMPDKLWD